MPSLPSQLVSSLKTEILPSHVVCLLANEGALAVYRNHPLGSVHPTPVHRILQGTPKASGPLGVI